jgi:hypothetical protein
VSPYRWASCFGTAFEAPRRWVAAAGAGCGCGVQKPASVSPSEASPERTRCRLSLDGRRAGCQGRPVTSCGPSGSQDVAFLRPRGDRALCGRPVSSKRRVLARTVIAPATPRRHPAHSTVAMDAGIALAAALSLQFGWFVRQRTSSSTRPDSPREALNLSPKPVPMRPAGTNRRPLSGNLQRRIRVVDSLSEAIVRLTAR